MSNVISLSGGTIDPVQEQESIVRVLERALELARAGQFQAVSVTAVKAGGIPWDILSVKPDAVLTLAGAAGITLRRIQEAVVLE